MSIHLSAESTEVTVENQANNTGDPDHIAVSFYYAPFIRLLSVNISFSLLFAQIQHTIAYVNISLGHFYL